MAVNQCRCGATHEAPYTVGVWEASARANYFGLGFVANDGIICCSYNEGKYSSYQEAKEEADNTTLEQALIDSGAFDNFDEA